MNNLFLCDSTTLKHFSYMLLNVSSNRIITKQLVKQLLLSSQVMENLL